MTTVIVCGMQCWKRSGCKPLSEALPDSAAHRTLTALDEVVPAHIAKVREPSYARLQQPREELLRRRIDRVHSSAHHAAS